MPSRIGITAVGAGIGMLALVSCSALIDSGGLSGGSRSSEGGPSSSSSSSSSSGDAESAIDASSSSGDATSIRPLCAEKNRFCTTFDDITEALPITTKNGSGQLTASPFVSPPQAFESDVTPTSTENAHAALDLNLGPVASTLHVEYDVQILQAPTDYVETTYIRVDTPSAQRCAFFLIIGSGTEWIMNAGCPPVPSQFADVAPIVLSQWNHVVWDIQADGKGTLRFNARSFDFTLTNNGLAGGGDLRVVAGVYYAKPGSNRARTVLDNLLIRD